ncbi:MAG: acetylxylan esterase [Bacteroidales bacterium]|nr:acetylxylan esterase [Bacteroidales bacterium]
MTKRFNHILFTLAISALFSAVSCTRQAPVASLPLSDNTRLYSAAIDSICGPGADSLFAICSTSWLMTGNGPFSVTVYVSGNGRFSLPYSVTADLDLMDESAGPILTGTVSVKAAEGRYTPVKLSLGKLNPGFYQVSVAGQALSFNVGVNPELVVSPADAPEDFDDFWAATLSELASVPMDAVMTEVPEHSSAQRTCYEVRIPSIGGAVMGGRIYIPVAEGKYPVRLEYMGYGAEPFWHDPDAAPDRIEFLVSVRDQGIFKEGQSEWIDRGLDSRENFYYRGAFCDVARAVDFVCSLPQADTARIFACGDSQGGAFTWISAALTGKLRAIAPSVPFLGDYPDYARIVWWPMHEVFEHADAQGIARADLLDMMRYFDVKNFTPRISCPVYMAFGLQDPTCPPHTNFAEYNLVNAEKQYLCVPWCGHAMWAEPSWAWEREEFFKKF